MLFYTIESLKKQSRPPDSIHVNISCERYLSDVGISDCPEWLHHDRIQVNWVENIGPYRKLLPSLNSCATEDWVVTADDDILYHPDWLSSLAEAVHENPNHIVCARARYIKKNKIGRCENYSRWNLVRDEEFGMNILPTGGGGVVYKKELVDMAFLNDRRFLEIAPTSDDLWFRMASMRKNVPVYVKPQINTESIYLRHEEGLGRVNYPYVGEKFVYKLWYRTFGAVRDRLGIDFYENDKAWSRICRYCKKGRSSRPD